MTNTCIIGAQWGDEGKGKITDYLAKNHDVVVRFAGGSNAGHTIIDNGNKFVLHLMPSGAIYGKSNIIGNGVVINFDVLDKEVEELKNANKYNKESFVISDKAHIVTPYHLYMDLIEEVYKNKLSGKSIGTTLQGIGPTYQTKVGRTGLRICDVFYSNEKELELIARNFANIMINKFKSCDVTTKEIRDYIESNESNKKMTKSLINYLNDNFEIDFDKFMIRLKEYKKYYITNIKDTSLFLYNQHQQNKNILFEGAQGTFLDIDHGTYPYVTSSNTTIGGIYSGTGIAFDIENRIGIVKAYTTRVGNGGFPTEMTGEIDHYVRTKGLEYGATTGRNRRCGWLDLFMLKYSTRINGLNQIALTKLDILDDLEYIDVCIEYKLDGQSIESYPCSDNMLKRVKPIYKRFDGWKQDTSNIRSYNNLPNNAKKYIEFIENYLNVHIKYISIGADRNQIIIR